MSIETAIGIIMFAATLTMGIAAVISAVKESKKNEHH